MTDKPRTAKFRRNSGEVTNPSVHEREGFCEAVEQLDDVNEILGNRRQGEFGARRSPQERRIKVVRDRKAESSWA